MPVHNGATYLESAIDSILAQTFIEFEFLIIDDCSTDDTADIVNSYEDKRIRFVRSESRLKLAGALNLGMAAAHGEFIARMDSDDVSEPERLRLQFEFLSENRDYGICGSWTRYFPGPHEKIQKYPVDKDSVYALSLFDSPFAHPAVMIRRDLFEKNGLNYDISYFPTEDFDLWTRALALFKGINLNKVLLNYRTHAQSLTGADWSTMDEQAARITRRGLNSLNLPADEQAGRYHRKIAMAQVGQSKNELRQAAQWLQGVAEANRIEKVYSENALGEIIEDFWFRNCMHCTRSGFWPLKIFLHHRFSNTVCRRPQKIGVLTASCMKSYMMRTGS